jgi:hypothetical protein
VDKFFCKSEPAQLLAVHLKVSRGGTGLQRAGRADGMRVGG